MRDDHVVIQLFKANKHGHGRDSGLGISCPACGDKWMKSDPTWGNERGLWVHWHIEDIESFKDVFVAYAGEYSQGHENFDPESVN